MSFKQNFYKVQGKLSLFMFIYGIPKFIILLHSSLELKAIIVWLEAIHCLGDTFNSLIVFMLCKIFGKNKHELNDTKVEKIETIVGVVCDFAIVMGLSSMVFISVADIIHPHKTNSNLFLVVSITIISIIFDTIFLKRQKAVLINNDHILAKTELSTCIEDILFDSIELVSLLIIVIFKRDRFTRYLAPLLCILISIVAIHESIIRIANQKELLNKICA